MNPQPQTIIHHSNRRTNLQPASANSDRIRKSIGSGVPGVKKINLWKMLECDCHARLVSKNRLEIFHTTLDEERTIVQEALEHSTSDKVGVLALGSLCSELKELVNDVLLVACHLPRLNINKIRIYKASLRPYSAAEESDNGQLFPNVARQLAKVHKAVVVLLTISVICTIMNFFMPRFMSTYPQKHFEDWGRQLPTGFCLPFAVHTLSCLDRQKVVMMFQSFTTKMYMFHVIVFWCSLSLHYVTSYDQLNGSSTFAIFCMASFAFLGGLMDAYPDPMRNKQSRKIFATCVVASFVMLCGLAFLEDTSSDFYFEVTFSGRTSFRSVSCGALINIFLFSLRSLSRNLLLPASNFSLLQSDIVCVMTSSKSVEAVQAVHNLLQAKARQINCTQHEYTRAALETSCETFTRLQKIVPGSGIGGMSLLLLSCGFRNKLHNSIRIIMIVRSEVVQTTKVVQITKGCLFPCRV